MRTPRNDNDVVCGEFFIFNCRNMLKFVGQILLRNSKICWIMCEKKEELKYAI